MREEGWSADDSAEHKLRIDYADLRLEGWARWSGLASPELIGFSTSSSFVSAMTPQDEELQAGARHLAQECSDEEAMAVDAILAGWKKTDPRYWKIVRKEYLTWGASEKKARELGMNRTAYRQQLDALRIEMFRALDSGARNAISGSKLGAVPAKNARR